VFEEVRESSLVTLLIFGTHVVPKVYRDDRQSWLAAADHIEAVAQRRLRELEICQGRRCDRHVSWSRQVEAEWFEVTIGSRLRYYLSAMSLSSPAVLPAFVEIDPVSQGHGARFNIPE
jgi:hypothetical protein